MSNAYPYTTEVARKKELTAVGVAHDMIVDTLADFVCPDTGIVDYVNGEGPLIRTGDKLEALGFPPTHIKVFVAQALLSVGRMHRQLRDLTPEAISV